MLFIVGDYQQEFVNTCKENNNINLMIQDFIGPIYYITNYFE